MVPSSRQAEHAPQPPIRPSRKDGGSTGISPLMHACIHVHTSFWSWWQVVVLHVRMMVHSRRLKEEQSESPLERMIDSDHHECLCIHYLFNTPMKWIWLNPMVLTPCQSWDTARTTTKMTRIWVSCEHHGMRVIIIIIMNNILMIIDTSHVVVCRISNHTFDILT